MTVKQMEGLAEGMRRGMRRVAQGVTVISLVDGDGQRLAMTASSVTSVSAEPPSMLVCVHRDASAHLSLSESRPFCINVLDQEMEGISNLCAGQARGEERFAEGQWLVDPTSRVPYLERALVNFFCIPDAILDYGTHLICVGKLDAVIVHPEERLPLLYHNGRYGTFKPRVP